MGEKIVKSVWIEEFPDDEVLHKLYVTKQLKVEEIAQRYGVSPSMVYGWLQADGIKRNRLDYKGPTQDELRHLYEDQNLSIRKIANLYGVTHGAVDNWLKKYKIKKRPKNGPKYKPLTREELIDLYEVKQLSTNEIAQAYNVSDSTVNRWLKAERIEMRKAVGPREHKWPARDELIQLYHGQNMSILELAQVYGVTHGAIEYWLKSYEIKGHPKGKKRP